MTAAYRKLLHIILLICPIFSYSQSWEWQNPKPFGDGIRNIYFLDDQYGWAMPYNNTLYHTRNGGVDWEILYTGIVFNDLYFTTPDKGWGIGRTEVWRSENAIYHTTDGGVTWTMQLPESDVRYDIFFLDSQTGWASGDGGNLFKTVDGGISWSDKYFGAFFDAFRTVYFKDSLNGWVAGGLQHGYRTRDGGETWEPETILNNISYFAQSDSLHFWGLTSFWEMVRSTDGGETWVRSEFDTPGGAEGADIQALNNQTVYIGATDGLYKSVDGGITWAQTSTQRIVNMHFFDVQNGWATGNQSFGELLITSDGGANWTNTIKTNNPLGFKVYRSVDFIDSHTGWVVGGIRSPALLKTIDGGETFDVQDCNANDVLLDVAFIDNQTGWVVGREGVVCHTNDGGNTWTHQNSNTDYSLNSVHFINSQNGWIVGDDFTDGVILTTNNGGSTWTDVAPQGLGASFRDVWFVDASTGWVVGGGGNAFDGGVILKTFDGGLTWEVQRESQDMELNTVQFIDSLVGYVAGYDPISDSGILFTEDGGQSWLSRGKPTYPSSMIFLNKDNGWICDWGSRIFFTDNGGISWSEQETYMSQNLHDIDFVDLNTGWVVGDFGAIMKTTSGGVTGVETTQIDRMTDSYQLKQNYPNPFNNTTKIRFSLQKQGTVRIDLFNTLGKKVSTIFNGHLGSGEQEVGFDSGSLPSGIYFYRLESERYSAVRKMVLMR